jgi:hypothetical protein
MDTPFNEGAACITAGGPKSSGAFLGRECHQNSAKQPGRQERLPLLDSREPGAMLVLCTHYSRWLGRGLRLTKLVRRGGDPSQIAPTEEAKYFQCYSLDVSTFDKLRAAIGFLLGRPEDALVQGARIRTANPAYMRRLLYDTPDPKDPSKIDKATITDKPTLWLVMDIDDLQPPPGVGGLLDKALWVRSQLPPEFRHSRCIAVATSGYGIKRGARLRLWFMLDRAVTCAEKRRWLKPVKFIDIGLYSPNQLVYSANPVFEDPEFDDPLFDMPRLVVLDGEEFVRTPRAERLKPAVHDYHASISRAASTSNDDNGLILSAMVAIDAATPGGRHNQIMREAFTLAGFAVAGGVSPDMALRGLIRAGTKIIPGAREITSNEIIRQWEHALMVKEAEWAREQRHPAPSSYDEED